MTDIRQAQAGIADALTELSEETRVLVRAELESAEREAWGKLKRAAPGIALVSVGGALGLAAGASSYRFCLRVLERMLGPSFAALAATAGFGGAAYFAVRSGIERLRAAPAPLPTDTARETAATVKETAETVRAEASSEPTGEQPTLEPTDEQPVPVPKDPRSSQQVA